MHLGISTYTFPWSIGVPGHMPASPMNAAALMQLAVDNNVLHVQFGDNLPLHTLSADELNGIVEFAEQHALNIEVGMRGLRAQDVTNYIYIADKLGSSFLRIVIDDAGYYPDVDDVISTINSLLPLLSEKHIILAIENHDRFSSSDLQRIINDTDETLVGICLDTANSYGALEGTYETVKLLAPFTVNLHLKDIRIARVEHKMGFHITGTAAGEGMLNIPWIIDHVRNFGRCRSATLELWSDRQSSIDATISKEKVDATKSIQYLKQLLHE